MTIKCYAKKRAKQIDMKGCNDNIGYWGKEDMGNGAL